VCGFVLLRTGSPDDLDPAGLETRVALAGGAIVPAALVDRAAGTVAWGSLRGEGDGALVSVRVVAQAGGPGGAHRGVGAVVPNSEARPELDTQLRR